MALLRRNTWLLPLLFAVALGAVGWNTQRALESAMKEQLTSKLETIRDAEVAAIRLWAEENKAVARAHVENPVVRELILELLRVARGARDPGKALATSPALAELQELTGMLIELHGYSGWGSQDAGGLMIANQQDGFVGLRPQASAALLPRIFDGETLITPPLPWDSTGRPESQVPVIIVGAPVRDGQDRVVASFGFALRPEAEFSGLLTLARPGETGETYAFDENGVLLSPSRFDEELRALGLLGAEQSSFMNIHIRDPGGSLVGGHAPELPVRARPLTRMAASGVTGKSGVDVDGYRDYRGSNVVGAWSWIPELGFGIATEMDADEAYQGLLAVQRRFWAVTSLLVLAAIGMFLYSFVLVRLRSQMDEARQLGRYRIERKLGSGGMGTVYLASHALLRRPTAIKLLRPERAGNEGVARFEREVQVTSALSHPNTIAIYDYGHTPDGTFYYAMEYLEGITLGQCVESDGAQPEARVLHVLKQACGSIAEAHTAGLMHRDLKPSNIMLCEIGGMFDFTKVLDFGLVRQEEQARDLALTDVASLTGTPLYMPPESVKTPEALDVRGDVYQLGAIAYHLLVGRHLFEGESAYEVMARHVSTPPTPPSEALGHAVSADLEKLILACLEKNPANRPANAGELLDLLEHCQVAGSWSQREARDWWVGWREGHPAAPETTPETSSLPSSFTLDFAERLVGRRKD
jgi:hypothetical protein